MVNGQCSFFFVPLHSTIQKDEEKINYGVYEFR